MNPLDQFRFFGHNNIFLEADLRRLEEELEVDLGHRDRAERGVDEKYYPQFSQVLRLEAERMAQHYTIFYCLENFARELISSRLLDAYGANWWPEKVPEQVRRNAESNQKRELASGITPRSSELIDYSNFGELAEIVKTNWDLFGDTFRDIRALERVLANLNTLRAPIAHCKPLAEDEVLRLHLSLRDFFRQMS